MTSSCSNRAARLVAAAILLLAAGPAGAACDREDLFGAGWLDLDGDGRDTRLELLEEADQGGYWLDPYDGVVVHDPRALDIDHVVPLCLAARWGASEWPAQLRHQFANDPLNLVAVSAGANRSKADRPPSAWMPRNVAFWGPYLAQMHAVLDKYPLRLPRRERRALACYARFVQDTGKGFRPGRWGC